MTHRTRPSADVLTVKPDADGTYRQWSEYINYRLINDAGLTSDEAAGCFCTHPNLLDKWRQGADASDIASDWAREFYGLNRPQAVGLLHVRLGVLAGWVLVGVPCYGNEPEAMTALLTLSPPVVPQS